MNEFALIQRYFAGLTEPAPSVLLGIGDDCALLIPPVGQSLAVSIDTQVEGVHFPPGAAAQQIGSRVACCALSDLAAMGAQPLWATLALSLPKADTLWLEAFAKGLAHVLRRFNVALVGGDTTSGPLSITLQVHGGVESSRALRRSGAQLGDRIYVTGYLGDGAAALALLEGRLALRSEAQAYLMERFYAPDPQIEAGLRLAGRASSAIDISDGLLADLGHILTASQVGARLELACLPLNPLWATQVDADCARRWALSGGDDYQLCFTLAPDQTPPVAATCIGTITQTPGIIGCEQGREHALLGDGFAHFR